MDKVSRQTDLRLLLVLLEQVSTEATLTSSICGGALKPLQRIQATNPFDEPAPLLETGAPLFMELEQQLRDIQKHLTLIQNNIEVLEL